MKDILRKIGNILNKIYGYSIMICMFAGGLTFLGYIIAIFIGGEVATQICDFMYNRILKEVIYISSLTVLVGLLSMYLCNEKALAMKKEKK